MSFCPRCGAPTTSSMSFCTSCGAGLAPATYAPAAPAAPPAPLASPSAPAIARGPVGMQREPWLVVLLTLVTLGIYTLYYWWVVSKEVDEHARKPGHSHGLVKTGILVTAVSLVVFLFAFFSFFGAMFAEVMRSEATGADPGPEFIGAAIGAVVSLVVSSIGLMAGGIILLVGKYRLWQVVEEDERARLHPSPLSAVLMLVLTLAAYFVPFAGIVLPFIVLYMTQDHLNQRWAAVA